MKAIYNSMIGILFVMIVFITAGCCSLCRPYHRCGHSGQTIKTSDTLIIHDTVRVYVKVPVLIKDTTGKAAQGKQLEYNSKAIDSLSLALAVKDAKLRDAIWKLMHKKFNMDTVFAESKYSLAYAFVSDNVLQIFVKGKDIDTTLNAVVDVPVDHKQINNNSNTTVVTEKRFWQDMWFWIAIGLLLVIILLVKR